MNHLIDEVRKQQPLIHNITNQVVMNFTANGLYAVGAAPVMAHAKEEVEEMAQIASALLLNIGTLTKEQVDAMVLAGKAANQAGVPVVLDPVGVGATTFRTDSAKRILQEVNVTCIRGNAGEIANLAGVGAQVRGVEGSSDIDVQQLASLAFDTLQVPLAITGEKDVVIDKNEQVIISNGHPLLTKVTGAGCLLSAVIAAFLSVSDKVTDAISGALSYYGVAAENAAEKHQYPGSFQIAFLDQLFAVDGAEVNKKKRITRSS
ncbi:hydroxyethylthiazole kinase [Gracilibacillus salitolerans]|uniref:Hydroxyethylthiazole kinase n=1 Tax=Gracilibacillus salitolerans TaxID=2663022 RepID=A0A5Q2TGK9_9BACI|nr:hydroxyethylthiazole kinase [Gracilibacillus salitolerans]QGH33070.1 hydroxyethylthiazole kinase [Gracilibacillus salitolerans]